MTSATPWWQSAVIYQVYPRSFQDSNGDGIGDLKGIEARLDHLVDLVVLGVDAIWISPIFVSPMADFGYDVADYCDVDPRFGSLADFDSLIAAARARGLKLLLDFVPNHTSSEHPWFRASRSSRDDPKRDWYIWRNAAPDGGPPNNWISDFGGSAWEWDEGTGQYYYHAFLKEQADLNWRNPDVVAAMMDVLRFWFARGVDGFRIDVLWHMVKHPDFPDNPWNPDWVPAMGERDRVFQTNSTDQPRVHDIAAAMRVADLAVIPFRPAVFDIAAVAATLDMARTLGKAALPVINSAPPRRGIQASHVVVEARDALFGMNATPWAGQITTRAAYAHALASGQAVGEFEPASAAAGEMVELWAEVRRSLGMKEGPRR